MYVSKDDSFFYEKIYFEIRDIFKFNLMLI